MPPDSHRDVADPTTVTGPDGMTASYVYDAEGTRQGVKTGYLAGYIRRQEVSLVALDGNSPRITVTFE